MNRNILIVCSTNTGYMPYLNNYTLILDERKIDYDLLVWNRMNLEEKQSLFVYKDGKNSVRRGFIDYFKFYRFLKGVLAKNRFNKIIIFGLQTLFFCQGFLCNEYSKRYLLDIRDYHILAKATNLQRVINNAKYTVISSPGYKEFLPTSFDYIVNHNTTIDSNNLPSSTCMSFNSSFITYMGALRDLEINKEFIKSLKDSPYEAYYAGESDYTKQLKDFVEQGNFRVRFTGRYKKEEEKTIYGQTLLVNVLRYADSLNNIVALPNRLYNAPIYMKPLLSYKGTYLSKLIEEYKLGLIINDFNHLSSNIENYINGFIFEEYLDGRNRFLNKVIQDNLVFKQKLLDFCENN